VNFVKVAQCIRPCGAFIFHILVKIAFLGGPTPLLLHRWGEIWHGVGDPSSCLISPPSVQRIAPGGGERTQNRPLSKLNTGRLALRAMLPVINRQTKKLNVFGCPGGGWNPSPTKLGTVTGDLEHVFAPLKLLGVWRIVSPLGGTEYLGETRPLNLKPSYLHNPSSKSNQILIANAFWNGHKFCKFCENRARDTAGRLYFPFWSNLSTNFSFGSYTLVVAPMGVKFGILRDKFHPIGAKRRPCGAKNLEIGLSEVIANNGIHWTSTQ